MTRLGQIELIEHNPQVNQRAQLTQEEIVEFSGQLQSFGLSCVVGNDWCGINSCLSTVFTVSIKLDNSSV